MDRESRPLSGLRRWRPARALAAAAAVALAVAGVAGCSTARASDVATARAGHPTSSPTGDPQPSPTTSPPLPTPSPRLSGAVPVSKSTHWKVVALGDSVPAGAACHCTPFPADYAHDLTVVRGIQTTAENLAVDGSDTSDLLSALQDERSHTARAVALANIDLVTIGANDFSAEHGPVTSGACTGACLTKNLTENIATMKANLGAILDQIHRLRDGLPTAVLVTGYWNVFEDGKVARQAFPAQGIRATRQLTALVNDAIADVTSAHGATYVDLVEPFNGPAAKGNITNLLASDGNHPSSAGQQLIARRLLAAGLRGLVRG